MSKLDICLVVAVTLLSVGLLVTTSAKTIKVSDGKSLKEHLCAGSVAPNTNLIITVNISLTDEVFCLIENTSNISITAKVPDYHSHITVRCHGCIFGFFNISNLTIRSVEFDGFGAIIPPRAVRYINGTDQFLYYNNTKTALIFNHCINLTLYNVLISVQNDSFGVIGVNTCGHSKISTVARENHSYPRSTLLMYYTDSMLESFTTECNLNITSPSVYTLPENYYYDIQKYLNDKPHKMSISVVRGFAVYLTQQKFNVTVNTTVTPTCKPQVDYTINTAFILFVNSITDSLVTFQGYPFDFCMNDTRMLQCNGTVTLTALEVLFYETPSFNTSFEGTTSPLLIKDTSFLMIEHGISHNVLHENAVLLISKITLKTSHEIVMESVSWCKNVKDYSFYGNPSTYFQYLFLAQAELHASNMKRNLILNLHNIFMLNNENTDNLPYPTPNSLMNFINVGNVTMTGTNYFAHNDGGSVIILQSSNLTVSGNITINDGYSYYGGGIRLDTTSTLFLKEPLSAHFSNNNALKGSAIYAPVNNADNNADDTSPIQISPIENYSVDNVTDINIKLYFSNNTFGSAGYSLYAPLFSVFGRQTSPNFLFDKFLWDVKYSQYVYTTLIDAIIQGTDMFDKYSSLSNGVCFRPNREDWKCIYIDYSFHYIQQLPVIYAYPGETALSVADVSNRMYVIRGVDSDSYVDSIVSNSAMSFTFYCDYEDSDCNLTLTVANTELYLWPILTILIETCPFGFNLTGYSCRCPSLLETHNYKCDINSLLFTSPTGYWTGLNNNKILFDRNCPPHYCNHSFKTFYLDSSIADLSCLNNHTGNLCGLCKENYSAVFGSDACYSDCTDLYLLTLPVYALVGLLLVTVLFALRLTVATGTVNGIIFYANTLSLVMNKLTESSHGSLQTTQVVIISLLNLNLGFPLCFYNGMTTAAKVGFQFVFPIYLWSIVIGMTVMSKYSIKLSNFISNSSVQVLATLLYLSFAKLLRTVIDIASPSKIHSVTLTHHASSKIYYYGSHDEAAVWYYNGEAYGQGIHGLLLAVAVAFTALYLLPYGILTTFSHWLMRFRLFNRLRPFIDAYGGPFKNKWRFWFGLRLWLVVVLFSVDGGLQGTNTRSMLIIHFIVILSFILFQVWIHPYKNRFVELLDTFLMTNYWLIIASYFLLGTLPFSTAYNLLVSSAILILVLVFPYRFWCLLQRKFFTNIKFKSVRYFYQHGMILNNEEDDNEGDDDMYLFQAAEERDHIPDTY